MSYFDDFLKKMPDAINRAGTNVQKLVHFITDPLADSAGLFKVVEDWRNIDEASGKALDALGKKYSQARGPAEDDFYRVMIKSKIIVRSGDDTVNGILRAVQVSLNASASGIKVESIRPESTDDGEPLAIRITNVPADIVKTDWERDYLISRIESVVAAGVRVDYVQFVNSAGMVASTVVVANTAIIYNSDGTINS